jgi:hypothetical protein
MALGDRHPDHLATDLGHHRRLPRSRGRHHLRQREDRLVRRRHTALLPDLDRLIQIIVTELA